MTEKSTARKRTRPETTLFLNLSVDGRITSHDSDDFDPDPQWKQQPGIRGILQQFYDFAAPGMTALTTGGFMKALGINDRSGTPRKETFNLVVLDPDADLSIRGLSYLAENVQHLYLISLNNHPVVVHANTIHYPLTTIHYAHEIDLNDAFTKLYKSHHLKSLFIHSIAPLNADLLDANLIDHLSVIISPLLVGGHGTPALQSEDIFTVRPLVLESIQTLTRDYVNLRYEVI